MGKKIDYMKYKLREAKLIPGPGAYNSSDQSDMGRTSANLKSTIGKGDRFKRTSFYSPPPNSYSVMATSANAKHVKPKQAVFGSNSRKFSRNWIDDHRTPGPGTYTSFSEFHTPN